MIKAESQKFHFQPVDQAHRSLVHHIDIVLCKPLMAHLSTVADEEPRESPVWFIWEVSSLWIFGIESDSFIKRLRKEPRCAVGIVEFDLNQGILKHVGIRGISKIHSYERK